MWDGRSSHLKAEGAQLSVIPCLTCLEVWVCIHPPASVTSAHCSAMTALTSVCIPESFQFLLSRSCVNVSVGGSAKPSKGLEEWWDICLVYWKKQLVSDLPERGGVSASGNAAPASAADNGEERGGTVGSHYEGHMGDHRSAEGPTFNSHV